MSKKGKIAQLPEDLREAVNRMIEDAAQHRSIINELEKHRHRFALPDSGNPLYSAVFRCDPLSKNISRPNNGSKRAMKTPVPLPNDTATDLIRIYTSAANVALSFSEPKKYEP